MAFLARAFVRDIRTERGLDEAWLPDLDGDELDALDWWPGGSMRPLRRAVETILASRDAYTPRH
jgi:ATP-dependent Lon protease